MFACIIKSDLKFPPDMHKMIVIYLLIGIGLHGGKALATSNMGDALPAVWAALGFGIGLPIIAYIILRAIGKIDPLNAAAISAHYGSVSAGTYMTAVAFLGGIGVTYEAYPVIMLAIMESPAIMIGLVLAGYSRKIMGGAQKGEKGMMKHLMIEAFTNGSILLLFGSMAIGAAVSDTSYKKIEPFFETIFMGALCIFLSDMGMEAGKRLSEFKQVGVFLVGFGIVMPIDRRVFRDTGRSLLPAIFGRRRHAGDRAGGKLFLYCGAAGDAPCDTGGQSIFLSDSVARVYFPVQRGDRYSHLLCRLPSIWRDRDKNRLCWSFSG